ncbi:MAG TPA: methylmalonyl-CoA mutase family protein, partial [Candidatus Methylomirabilis sp.]|nr:methylmalonyl-CoA mutase family protein [Candidatus Methylomirabilis sp.]
MSTKTTAGENLLEEFPPVSTEQWEQVIQKDLKGADYAKKLLWKTEDGLILKPYYRSEDLGGITFLDAAAGEFPYVRGNRASGGWEIREEIEARNPEEANRLAREALAAGAEEIAFQSAPVSVREDLVRLLDGLGTASVHFSQATPQLLQLIAESGVPANGSADFDPLGDLDFAAKVLSKVPASFRPFSIPVLALEEAGATAAQQLGYGIAAGIDYLDGVT